MKELLLAVEKLSVAVELLKEVSDNPDDYIKHHDSASEWLGHVREFLTELTK